MQCVTAKPPASSPPQSVPEAAGKPAYSAEDARPENSDTVHQDCGRAERYQVIDAGTGGSPHDGSGLVRDQQTHLSWTRNDHQAARLTRAGAEGFCHSRGMRLPTKDEALGISGPGNDKCAFPSSWYTWTSSDVKPGVVWSVSYTGVTVPSSAEKGWNSVMCVRPDMPPANEALRPAGQGWWCTQHRELGLSSCSRTQAECEDVRHELLVDYQDISQCQSQAQAVCFTYEHPKDGPTAVCAASLQHCWTRKQLLPKSGRAETPQASDCSPWN